MRSVARVDHVRRRCGRGTWESSGIVDAGDLLGRGWWFLVDVQAHIDHRAAEPAAVPMRTELSRPGRGPWQFLALYVPGSQ